MVSLYHEDGLSLVIQVQCVYCHTILHAIVHSSDTAANLHVVNPLGR